MNGGRWNLAPWSKRERSMELTAPNLPVVRHRSVARLYATLVVTALLAGGMLAGPAFATTPRPAPGQVVGPGSDGDRPWVLWQTTAHRLWSTRPFGFDAGTHDLGGYLTSGPFVVHTYEDIPLSRSPAAWMLARGRDGAVWSRYFSAENVVVPLMGWASRGGYSLGAPTGICIPPSGSLIVWVRGGDSALWRRSPEGRWVGLGGRLASDPAAPSSTENECSSREEVFALGTDHAVWEHVDGAWQRIGGRSSVAPAAVPAGNGDTDLFVRGTDNALWMATRAAGAATWSGWRRIGGVLTSPPAGVLSGMQLSVFVLGADGNVWQTRNTIGTSTWTWTHVP